MDHIQSTDAIDPVCGMTVDPANAAGSSEFNGQTYWFCNAGCKQRFDADPKKYLASAPDESAHAGHDHAAHAGHPHAAQRSAGGRTVAAQPMVQLGMKRAMPKPAAHDAHAGHDHAAHVSGGIPTTQPVVQLQMGRAKPQAEGR